jgi:hypothetical protein
VPAEWVLVEPATITLYPASTGTVTVTFRPPRASTPPAGDLPFGVRIVPVEYPDAAVLEEGVLSIEAFWDLSAQLRPGSRSGRIGARYRVDTDNRGNVAERLAYAAEDSTRKLALTLRPATAEVPGGAVDETRLRVRVRRLLWWGEPRELPFVARVQRDDSTSISLDGRFVQRPIISAGLLRLLAALLALLLALLALWFGVLRPAVRSTAKEAADEAAAERAAQESAAVQTQPAQQPGGGGGGSSPAGGGGQPGGGQSAGAGQAGAGGQFSAAISFRTNPNGSAAQSYTVPDGQVFLLTDFLVDNVQGDEGTLVVTANSVRVVSFALENFRNQDYHSVTPIRVPAKAKVTLTVACRKPGTPAGAKQAGSCLESLYLNGIMAPLAP